MPLIIFGVILLILVLVLFPLIGLMFSNPVAFAVGLIAVGLMWVVFKQICIAVGPLLQSAIEVSAPYLKRTFVKIFAAFSWFDGKVDNILLKLGAKTYSEAEQSKQPFSRKVSKDDIKSWLYIIIAFSVFASLAEFFNI